MATNVDLRIAVAEELSLKAAEETLSSADAALIDERASRVRAYLEERDLCFWPDNEIPESVMEPLTMLVASRCAAAFGAQYDMIATGMAMVAAVAQARVSNKPTKATYF